MPIPHLETLAIKTCHRKRNPEEKVQAIGGQSNPLQQQKVSHHLLNVLKFFLRTRKKIVVSA